MKVKYDDGVQCKTGAWMAGIDTDNEVNAKNYPDRDACPI